MENLDEKDRILERPAGRMMCDEKDQILGRPARGMVGDDKRQISCVSQHKFIDNDDLKNE